MLGSVMYLAAHPDDENTRLIAYLANERLLDTGYLSCAGFLFLKDTVGELALE